MRDKPIPVILDTDIGNDIDDNWALGLLLKTPELAPKLVLSCTGDTEYRALVDGNPARYDGFDRIDRAYLAGDLEGMMGTSTEFPTRTGIVISERDQRFRERMRPYLERGRCCALVGSAHMLNLRGMLVEDGFSVRPLRQGWTPLRERIRAALRKDAPIDPSGGMAW